MEASTIPSVSVSREEVNLLFSPRSESQFCNVYRYGRNRHGVVIWYGKIKECRVLQLIRGSYSTNRREVAAKVVAWYKIRYGDSWRERFEQRKSHRHESLAWRVSKARQEGKFILSVWVNGNPEVCCRMTEEGQPTDQPLLFDTPEEAREFRRKYMVYRYGKGYWQRGLWMTREVVQVPGVPSMMLCI